MQIATPIKRIIKLLAIVYCGSQLATNMVYSCCVPGCRTGYRPRKNDSATFEKVSVFKFPADEVMRQKRLKAIPRKNWTLADSHRVCAKHFFEKDFERVSSDRREVRKKSRSSQRLKTVRLQPSAVPGIFPSLPAYLTTRKPTSRASCCLSRACK